VITSRNSIGILPLKIIVPLTDWKDQYQTRVWMILRLDPTPENGLSKRSAADVFPVWSVSETRLIRQLGKLTDLKMRLIAQALAIVLSI
jgi:mRNA interferase MazF